jgi:hypothetical protein
MKDDQIDEYIAHFEILITKAGWQWQEKGSINIFFNGLTKSVQRKILSIYAVLPVTLDEWQAAARQVMQRNRLIDIKIRPWRPRERNGYRIKKENSTGGVTIQTQWTLIQQTSSSPLLREKESPQ